MVEIDSNAVAYLKKMNSSMKEHYGITYSEIMTDLHGDSQYWKTNYEKGVDALELVNNIGYQAGFITIATKDVEHATGYNLHKAALLNFVANSEVWQRGNEGTLYLPYEGGVALLFPSLNEESQRWAFRSELRDGCMLDSTGLYQIAEGTSREAFEGSDIDTSVEWVSTKIGFDNLEPSVEVSSPRF